MNNRLNSQTDDSKSTQRLQQFFQSCYKTFKIRGWSTKPENVGSIHSRDQASA
jgi:hypothetical protein